MAPIAGAGTQQPETPGADLEDVARIDGQERRAPPSSTAKRSSEMAPSTIFSRQT